MNLVCSEARGSFFRLDFGPPPFSRASQPAVPLVASHSTPYRLPLPFIGRLGFLFTPTPILCSNIILPSGVLMCLRMFVDLIRGFFMEEPS